MQNGPVSRQDYYICLKFLQGRKEEEDIPFLHGMLQKGQQILWAEFHKLHEIYPGNTKEKW